MRRRDRRLLRDMVLQRARRLYGLALEAARRGDIEYSRRLVELMFSLSRSTRVRLPRSIKRGVCRRCYAPLIPGVTARVRLRSEGRSAHISVVCLNCGWIHRYVYKPVRRHGSREEEAESRSGKSRRDRGEAGALRSRGRGAEAEAGG